MLRKIVVVVSFIVLVKLLWGLPFIGKSIPNLLSDRVPKLSPVVSRTYSGVLYKIEKNTDGTTWFTVLVDEDKTVKKFDVGPKVATESKISDLKVGDGILLMVQSSNLRQEVVSVLKKDNPLLWALSGKVVSTSGKKMVLNWYKNEITVNIGETAMFSFKYNKEMNIPGQQIEIEDFSRVKVGDDVVVGIDRETNSENLMINTTLVLN